MLAEPEQIIQGLRYRIEIAETICGVCARWPLVPGSEPMAGASPVGRLAVKRAAGPLPGGDAAMPTVTFRAKDRNSNGTSGGCLFPVSRGRWRMLCYCKRP